MLKDLILKNRSYRKFKENVEVSIETLKDLIDLARLSSSARNAQPLKYLLINDEATRARVFPQLSWAGYLKDWDGPAKGQRPAAYIVMLLDTEISANYFCDDGIASQSVMLGAVEKGLGGCIIGSVNRLKLQRELNIDERYKIVHVIALGEPDETVVIEDIKDNDYKYWRDNENIHHVPKRGLDEMIL